MIEKIKKVLGGIKDFFDIGLSPTPSPEILVNLRSKYSFFGPKILYKYRELKKCKKCEYENYLDLMSTKYDHELNVLIRTCSSCGNMWYEQCADGSKPNPEVMWILFNPEEK